MKLFYRCASAMLVVVFPVSAFAAAAMKEGMWEITTKVDIPGIPVKVPPQTVKHCYTKEEVKDQKKVVATQKDCTVTDFRQSGNKVTWKMKCTGPNAGTMTGETIFKGDSFASTMITESKGQKTKAKVNAKRVGACP